MATQLAPGIAEVAVKQTLNGEAIFNVVHFSNPAAGAWLASDLATLAQDVLAAFEARLPAILSVGWTLDQVVATDIGVEGGAQATAVPGGPVPGLINEQTLPNQIALVATVRTARVGRSYRGRLYLGGFAETQSAGSVVETSARAAITAAVDGLNDDLLAIRSGIWSVLSRRLNNVARPVGIGTPVTIMSLRNFRWDTMTSRLPAG